MLCMRASQRQKVTHGPVSCHKRALSKQGASLCRPKDESVGPRAANRFGVTPPPHRRLSSANSQLHPRLPYTARLAACCRSFGRLPFPTATLMLRSWRIFGQMMQLGLRFVFLCVLYPCQCSYPLLLKSLSLLPLSCPSVVQKPFQSQSSITVISLLYNLLVATRPLPRTLVSSLLSSLTTTMVIRSTAYPTAQQAHRVPAAVSLPPIQDLLPIHDLDLGHNGGFHTSRPVLPGPARFSSQPLTPPATLLHPVSHSETQEACHKCGALQWSTQTECTNCGSIKFTHPFQRNLDSSFSSNGYDESMRNNTPMSRRDSGMGRGSVGSYSDNSNPSSRRSSTTAATHPSARRKTAKETRAKKTAEIKMEKSTDANKRINKAARERGSRRGLKIETKRLEIRQMMRGWTASTNLNQNNQNKSGLNGKKIETLRRTNNEGRERDLAMIEIYNDIRRLVTIARKPHEARSADDYAYLREQEYHAAEHSDVLRDIMQREDIEVAAFMENLNAEEDDEDGVSTRYQTPQSPEDSAYGGSPHSYAL
ncbi:hypothetical protein BKA81DRAFT_90755 [Phyllosticta paracitricarpa]